MSGQPGGRLELLRRLTADLGAWALWKNGEATARGHGDVDAVLPVADRARAVALVVDWARERRFGPVVVCEHVPGAVVVAVRDGERLEQIDLVDRFHLLASAVASAGALAPDAEVGENGVRVLRPGAEGLLTLLAGLRPGAARPQHFEQLAGLLAADREGTERAASRLQFANGLALSSAQEVADGRWPRRALLALEARALLRAPAAPRVFLACLAFDARRRRCALLDALAGDRRVPPDAEAWLERVRRSHRVLETEPR